MEAFETWCAALAYHNKLDSAAAILQAPIAPSIRKLIDLQITVACSSHRLSSFGVVFIGHPAGPLSAIAVGQFGTYALSSHDSRRLRDTQENTHLEISADSALCRF
jgi:hypothetical protein